MSQATTNETPIDSAFLKASLLAAMRETGHEAKDEAVRSYYEARSRPAQLRRVAEVFDRYKRHLPTSGRLLDFGCGMGADSLLTRLTVGPDLEIHGADVDENADLLIRRKSGMIYRQLPTTPALPYESGQFDAIIASGVLEHVVMDNETLKEFHRIMANGATLIVTFLPNYYSVTEFLARRLKRGGHERMYRRSGFKDQLLHHGFSIIESGYHQIVPSAGSGKPFGWQQKVSDKLFALNPTLEKIWPINRFATNLFFVARRTHVLY